MIVKEVTETTKKKLVGGSLPDIDSDFCNRDRATIKAYMEERFGREQVSSVGTHTTFKIKGLLKDLARTTTLDFSDVNLITSIVDKDDSSMLDLMKRASIEPKLKHFIKENSDLFYMMPVLLNQPKTKSIHPCAVIVFPDVMTASEWAPMRTQQGLIVSEWSGSEMDDAGFLKDDILGIKQLDKFTDILDLIESNRGERPDIYNLPLDDQEVFRFFTNGWNGDVFQLGSSGLTEFTKSLKPSHIEDLIAAVAVFRPGPMENHYHTTYVKCKNEGRAPKYLWGTEEITANTYGLAIYQEQIMMIFQRIGNLSMKEADDVRRAIGKKKLDVLQSWKARVLKGYLEKGATEKDFEESWAAIEEFAKYGFNRSHSAAYAMTGYVSQYLKVHYPIEYWTVALNYANEEDALVYLAEVLQSKAIDISSPDVNKSESNMSSDLNSSSIFWGIEQIKGIGEDTANQIIEERRLNGPYHSFANFLERHTFTGSKVKKQTYEALIASGAFDKLYGFENKIERRVTLIRRFRAHRKVKVSNPLRDAYTIGSLHERYWWGLQQKRLTQLAFIDYKEIAEEKGVLTTFLTLGELNRKQDRGIYRAFGGYVVDVKFGKSKKGKYARLTVESNYKLFKLLIWSEEYAVHESVIKDCIRSLIVFDAEVRYDAKWSKANQFTLKSDSRFISLS